MNQALAMVLMNILSEPGKDWNWYTLDRELSIRGFAGQCHVPRAVSALEKEGLVSIRPGKSPAMPIYSITEKGTQWLKTQPSWELR